MDNREWEDTEIKCEECKQGLMQRTTVENGQDDYTYLYKCTNCGTEQES